MKEGDVCNHGIRWPHECRECADVAWENKQREYFPWPNVERVDKPVDHSPPDEKADSQ